MIDRRELLRGLGTAFCKGEMPDIVCPTCDIGHLVFDAEALQYETSVLAQRLRDHHPAWDPEMLDGTMTAALYCSRAKCGERAIIVGTWTLEDVGGYPYEEQVWQEVTRITHIEPPLSFVSIPLDCPESVRKAAASVGPLVLVDPDAAIGRLRFTLERLMDEQGVDRATSPSGAVSLARRLNTFAKKSKTTAAFFEALRWLGNEATHAGAMSLDDVVEAAEFLEEGLKILYPSGPGTLSKATVINQQRGTGRRKV